MMNRLILFIFIACFQCLSVCGQSAFDFSKLSQHKVFVNKSLDIDHFDFFFQDSIGRIWGGSNGLMMFDGESFVKKTPSIGTYSVYCALSATKYLIGSRQGLYLFNLQTMELVPIEGFSKDEVTGLYRISSQEVLVFCINRIVRLDLNQMKSGTLYSWSGYRMIQHILLPDNTFILLTDTRGLFRFELSHAKREPILLDNLSVKDDMLLCMLYDSGTLWLGSDRGLLKCDLQTHRAIRIPELEGISVKVLMKEKSGSLWMGTNSGLYIFDNDTHEWSHYLHSTQSDGSLLNDCVWSLFEDAEGNKWLGVDGGISFIPREKCFFKIKWSDLINTTEGNWINRMLHDSRGNYWFGGTNGLGYYNGITGKSIFFKKQGEHRIPNNTVRTIYEDKSGTVWIGTDGGFAWFNEKEQRFIFCNVEDAESGKNAIWTYGISEDREGNIWLATCSGGLFCVKRESLLTGTNKFVPALCNYCSTNKTHKIEYDGCLGMFSDSDGNIWVNAERVLYKIDNRNNQLLNSPSRLTSVSSRGVIALFCDEDGEIWGARRNALFKVNPQDNRLEEIDMNSYVEEYGDINCMTSCGDYIWFLTSRSVGVIHKQTYMIEHIVDLAAAQYKSCYYDRRNHLIWLGGIDHCLVIHPNECLKNERDMNPSAIISEIYVNGVPVSPPRKLNGRCLLDEDVAYCKQLNLAPEENSVAFRFSTGKLLRENERQSGYFYRIKELDESWKALNSYHPLIEYSYLGYGTYHLEIGRQSQNHGIDTIRTLNIIVQAPWYYTVWFRLLVAGVVIALFFAGINYYRVKSKLHIAEMDKQKTLDLSQMKMEFLTNMSHELKTPLSLILGPINKLLSTTRNSQSKALLQMIQENTMKLNSMVVQIINYKEDSGSSSHSVMSRMEAVEFMQSITSTYQEACDAKGVSLEFQSCVSSVYIEADPLKLESIINNLLSNAYKFTESGGRISVMVESKEEDFQKTLLKLTVSDTGFGIPREDLPYIFDRFYQSGQNREVNQDGSGIGLSMVKNYVAQHGGEVQVESEVGKGTTFIIWLPAVQVEEPALLPSMSGSFEERGLRVLVVEDNMEIARFIADNLKGMQCTMVHNGKSGLETAIRLLPDIIVADIMMPVMDGVEMSRLLKRNLSTATIPIILLTAKDNKQTELEAYKLGVDAFLPKPFEIDHLIARINQIVANKELLVRKASLSRDEDVRQEEVTMKETPDEKFLAGITNLIEEHLEDSALNVQKLAELSGLNEKQVYRKLKLLTGNTAVDYIKSIRLKKAAMLLVQKKFTVNEVMYMVGFSSPSYFAKCFSDKYGKTPKAYMEEATR